MITLHQLLHKGILTLTPPNYSLQLLLQSLEVIILNCLNFQPQPEFDPISFQLDQPITGTIYQSISLMLHLYLILRNCWTVIALILCTVIYS